jgi:hypothetical protein
VCPVGPLRSTVVTRFIATMSPADFWRRRFPLTKGVGFHPRHQISQVPLLIFRRALPPTTPGSPAAALAVSAAGVRPPILREEGRFHVRNEAESGSVLAARAFDPCLSAGGHLTVALRSFRGEVALVHGPAVYMSSERFTWSTPHS